MITAFRGDGHRPAHLALTSESFGRPVRLVIVTEDMGRFNLAGYDASIVVRQAREDRPLFTRPLTIVDAAGGVVEYVPDGRDYPGPGHYFARIKLKKPGVEIETAEFPITIY